MGTPGAFVLDDQGRRKLCPNGKWVVFGADGTSTCCVCLLPGCIGEATVAEAVARTSENGQVRLPDLEAVIEVPSVGAYSTTTSWWWWDTDGDGNREIDWRRTDRANGFNSRTIAVGALNFTSGCSIDALITGFETWGGGASQPITRRFVGNSDLSPAKFDPPTFDAPTSIDEIIEDYWHYQKEFRSVVPYEVQGWSHSGRIIGGIWNRPGFGLSAQLDASFGGNSGWRAIWEGRSRSRYRVEPSNEWGEWSDWSNWGQDVSSGLAGEMVSYGLISTGDPVEVNSSTTFPLVLPATFHVGQGSGPPLEVATTVTFRRSTAQSVTGESQVRAIAGSVWSSGSYQAGATRRQRCISEGCPGGKRGMTADRWPTDGPGGLRSYGGYLYRGSDSDPTMVTESEQRNVVVEGPLVDMIQSITAASGCCPGVDAGCGACRVCLQTASSYRVRMLGRYTNGSGQTVEVVRYSQVFSQQFGTWNGVQLNNLGSQDGSNRYPACSWTFFAGSIALHRLFADPATDLYRVVLPSLSVEASAPIAAGSTCGPENKTWTITAQGSLQAVLDHNGNNVPLVLEVD
jgi:hypothetical protein